VLIVDDVVSSSRDINQFSTSSNQPPRRGSIDIHTDHLGALTCSTFVEGVNGGSRLGAAAITPAINGDKYGTFMRKRGSASHRIMLLAAALTYAAAKGLACPTHGRDGQCPESPVP
jgi:hypothetical protein